MSRSKSIDLRVIADALAEHGLLLRGAFHPQPEDEIPGPCATLVMIGNAGADMWQAFGPGADNGDHPLNDWSETIITAIAEDLGGDALFPFGGPPYHPFQRWAKRAEAVFSSPIGPLIHPVYGLWHAYRGALAFSERLALPVRKEYSNPCHSCPDRPCLNTCPVDAFSEPGYDVPACVAHLESPAGENCLNRGCLARRACPVGRSYLYAPPQAAFHMTKFLRARQLAGGD